jgi:hypothetical protein
MQTLQALTPFDSNSVQMQCQAWVIVSLPSSFQLLPPNSRISAQFWGLLCVFKMGMIPLAVFVTDSSTKCAISASCQQT